MVEKEDDFRASVRWPDLCVQTFLHLGAFAGLFVVLAGCADSRTLLAGMSITSYVIGNTFPT